MKKTALLALALSISLCNLLADTSVIHEGLIDDLENKAAMAEVVWNIEDISKVSVYFSTSALNSARVLALAWASIGSII